MLPVRTIAKTLTVFLVVRWHTHDVDGGGKQVLVFEYYCWKLIPRNIIHLCDGSLLNQTSVYWFSMSTLYSFNSRLVRTCTNIAFLRFWQICASFNKILDLEGSFFVPTQSSCLIRSNFQIHGHNKLLET